MIYSGMLLAALSGVCNGLFSAPMKLESNWKWENIWFGFILVACIFMPFAIVFLTVPGWEQILDSSPAKAIISAIAFGFLWGFGAICFGRSVDRLGVSVANTLVIGISSALGSLVPLAIAGHFALDQKELTLLGGVAAFVFGVVICGIGGRLRDSAGEASTTQGKGAGAGYVFAVMSGVMSAVFNIGYSLALPIADTGVALGHTRLGSTNCIWLLMLGAGAVPNLVYCAALMRRHGTGKLLTAGTPLRSWALSAVMGLLWGGSIFLYGAATPRLGRLGLSVGWPLSLAVGLLVANAMGLLLGEWRNASLSSKRYMRSGIAILICAIGLCALSAEIGS